MWTRAHISAPVLGLALVAAALLSATMAGPAAAQAPMSAIDWLNDTMRRPVEAQQGGQDEAATSSGAGVEAITVTPLDGPSTVAVGLLPASVSGLAPDLWGTTPSAELAQLLNGIGESRLPAMQDLLITLLLTELDPPADGDPDDRLFLARVDTLMRFGAVEQAQALLERAGPGNDGARFRRWFDASLLTGTEDDACATLRDRPDLTDDLAARVFCLARGGDWFPAVLTLDSGRALGEIDDGKHMLMLRFLDPEMAEGAPFLAPPTRPSPLEFRLYEAIGEAMPTARLPLAYAQADLRPNTGWKAQIEAAERLARSGALPGNKLLGLYTDRLPAASGGVWDRVAAVQRFDITSSAGAGDAAGPALRKAWAEMRPVGLEVVFARLYADRLAGLELAADDAALAFPIALLSRDHDKVAEARAPADADERFLKAIARGDLAGVVPPDRTGRAVAEGFTAAGAAPALAVLIDRGETGAALLRAIAMMEAGAEGNLTRLSDALASLRALGLTHVARRAALQVMILDRG